MTRRRGKERCLDCGRRVRLNCKHGFCDRCVIYHVCYVCRTAYPERRAAGQKCDQCRLTDKWIHEAHNLEPTFDDSPRVRRLLLP